MLRDAAEYLLEFVATPWGPVIMVIHAFLESFILPIPHDVFLIAASLGHPKWSLVFALMSTIASTLGNMVGYSIGRFGGKPLAERFVPPKMYETAKKMLHKHDVWATAIACFTPFPDKVFSLCAGTFHLNFRRFSIVIFFSRAARFYLISLLLFFYGESMRDFLLEHTGKAMLAVIAFMLVSAICWKFIMNRFFKSLETH